MTNWEKYKEELKNINLDANKVHHFLTEHGMSWTGNSLLNDLNFRLWCEEEYVEKEEEVDWTKVPKGTVVHAGDTLEELELYSSKCEFYSYDPDLDFPFLVYNAEKFMVSSWKYCKLAE